MRKNRWNIAESIHLFEFLKKIFGQNFDGKNESNSLKQCQSNQKSFQKKTLETSFETSKSRFETSFENKNLPHPIIFRGFFERLFGSKVPMISSFFQNSKMIVTLRVQCANESKFSKKRCISLSSWSKIFGAIFDQKMTQKMTHFWPIVSTKHVYWDKKFS